MEVLFQYTSLYGERVIQYFPVCVCVCVYVCVCECLQLRPAINDTEGPWWRPVPGREECLVSLPSVPPGPILRDSVRLLQDVPLERSLGGGGDVVMVSLSLSWDPPSEPRGEIQRYDVYIGQRLLQGTEPTSSLFMTVRFSMYNIA